MTGDRTFELMHFKGNWDIETNGEISPMEVYSFYEQSIDKLREYVKKNDTDNKIPHNTISFRYFTIREV